MARTVWVSLLLRSFSPEELPQDLSFLHERSASLLRSDFWELTLQRPAFLSDAPRTSEIVEHAGSRFRKVLHIDGRRDLNFTTVFRGVPPGHYQVVWRLMLQPGYVRGYCNFRAVFSRPACEAASSKPRRHTCNAGNGRASAEGERGEQLQAGGRRRWRFGRLAASTTGLEAGHAAGADSDAEAAGAAGTAGHRSRASRRLWVRRGLRLLPSCMSAPASSTLDAPHPHRNAVAPRPDAAAVGTHQPAVAGPSVVPHAAAHLNQPGPAANANGHVGHPEIEPLPAQVPAPPPPPAPPAAAAAAPAPSRETAAAAVRQGALQRRLASASAKRDAALAAGGDGPRYVPRWLTPLWGGHACSWRQLDPAGPLGVGSWRRLQLGSLTVRRGADVHLHGVMVQLRPQGAAQEQQALPPGEERWRGALVDYVELVPVQQPGLLSSLLPGFAAPGVPVLPGAGELVQVPGL